MARRTDRYNHIVSRWAEFLSAIGLRDPRALCGASMVISDEMIRRGWTGPGPRAPLCPACRRRNGGRG